MFNRIVTLFALLSLSTAVFAQTYTLEDSPYGICAHISRGGNHHLIKEEAALMTDAGIAFARTDFDWSTVNPSQGKWDFAYMDETVNQAEANNIKILPILGYDRPWATPAYKHLDQWREYVRRIVTRYKDKIPYWEVWNEPNLEGFWHDTPNAENYTILLKATYEEIKAVDPNIQVLLCGVAGLPFDYIEGIYKAGGANYFDIMAVHPYRYPNPPEQERLYPDLLKLRKLMAKYGDKNKPIWTTEIGWPTHVNKSFILEQIIKAGMKSLNIAPKNLKLAILAEPAYLAQIPLTDEQITSSFGNDVKVDYLTMDQFKTINAKKYDIALLAAEESTPTELTTTIESFIRDGGTMIFPYGIPMYYQTEKDENGKWTHNPAANGLREKLGVNWHAWWSKKDVPKEIEKLSVPQAFADIIKVDKNYPKATRFLNTDKLAKTDSFTPLLFADHDNGSEPTAAVINYNGKYKGSAIISCLFTDFRGVSEHQQAKILPRTYLLSMLAGVDKTFWYNLKANENNPYNNEDNFGIVHKDLSPKPAYNAMKTLSQSYPTGSKFLPTKWQNDYLYTPTWKRPDGRYVTALWTSHITHKTTVRLPATTTVIKCYDLFGKPIIPTKTSTALTIPVTDEITYIITRTPPKVH